MLHFSRRLYKCRTEPENEYNHFTLRPGILREYAIRSKMANGFVSRTKAREDYNLLLNQKERLCGRRSASTEHNPRDIN